MSNEDIVSLVLFIVGWTIVLWIAPKQISKDLINKINSIVDSFKTITAFQSNDEQQIHALDQFYESQPFDDVIPTLQAMFKDSSFNDIMSEGPQNCVSYMFYRLAQQKSDLWNEYLSIFETSNHEQRVFILWVIGSEAKPFRDPILTSWKNNNRYQEEHAVIDEILSSDRGQQNALEVLSINSGLDLDRLWLEFIVTGNESPVYRIIDVLAYPDTIREKLNRWLSTLPSSTETEENILAIQTELACFDLLIDVSDQSIYSADDLDCHCMVQDCDINQQRFNDILEKLPFKLTDSELATIGIKAAAKWSLCSNAQQHVRVLNIINEELEHRTNSCRLALYEISIRAYLAVDDLESGFKKLFESLTLNPSKRNEQQQNAESYYEKSLTLTSVQAFDTDSFTKDYDAFVACCIDSYNGLSSYRSKFILLSPAEPPGNDNQMYWELEYLRPHRYRVVQVAGNDYDEWITIQQRHYRAMMSHTETPERCDGDFRINRMLLMDDYIHLIEHQSPDQTFVKDNDLYSFTVFCYEDNNAPFRSFGFFENIDSPISSERIVLWFDNKTMYLVKAEFSFDFKDNEESVERLTLAHLFSNFNDDIDIIPPVFEPLYCQPCINGGVHISPYTDIRAGAI